MIWKRKYAWKNEKISQTSGIAICVKQAFRTRKVEQIYSIPKPLIVTILRVRNSQLKPEVKRNMYKIN